MHDIVSLVPKTTPSEEERDLVCLSNFWGLHDAARHVTKKILYGAYASSSHGSSLAILVCCHMIKLLAHQKSELLCQQAPEITRSTPDSLPRQRVGSDVLL